MNNQVKARKVMQNEVNDIWKVYNIGREPEYVALPRSMESTESDAISRVFM